jgi:hypothetical protein
MSNKLQIKQVSGKPAIEYSAIEPGVIFTFNEGSPYGNTARLKTTGGHVRLEGAYDLYRDSAGVNEELCTVYKSTLTLEV